MFYMQNFSLIIYLTYSEYVKYEYVQLNFILKNIRLIRISMIDHWIKILNFCLITKDLAIRIWANISNIDTKQTQFIKNCFLKGINVYEIDYKKLTICLYWKAHMSLLLLLLLLECMWLIKNSNACLGDQVHAHRGIGHSQSVYPLLFFPSPFLCSSFPLLEVYYRGPLKLEIDPCMGPKQVFGFFFGHFVLLFGILNNSYSG